jgi:hypothetical protein
LTASHQMEPQCGDIFYTLEPARRVTPSSMSPFVHIARSSSTVSTHVSLDLIFQTTKQQPTANFPAISASQTPQKRPQTARILNASTFHHQNQPHIRNGVPDQQNTPEGAGPADRRQLGRAEIRRDERGQVRGRNRSGHCTVSGVLELEVFRKKGNGVGEICLAWVGKIADRSRTGQA